MVEDFSRSKDHQDNALFIFHVYLPYPEQGDYGRWVGASTSWVRFPQLWEMRAGFLSTLSDAVLDSESSDRAE